MQRPVVLNEREAPERVDLYIPRPVLEHRGRCRRRETAGPDQSLHILVLDIVLERGRAQARHHLRAPAEDVHIPLVAPERHGAREWREAVVLAPRIQGELRLGQKTHELGDAVAGALGDGACPRKLRQGLFLFAARVQYLGQQHMAALLERHRSRFDRQAQGILHVQLGVADVLTQEREPGVAVVVDAYIDAPRLIQRGGRRPY